MKYYVSDGTMRCECCRSVEPAGRGMQQWRGMQLCVRCFTHRPHYTAVRRHHNLSQGVGHPVTRLVDCYLVTGCALRMTDRLGYSLLRDWCARPMHGMVTPIGTDAWQKWQELTIDERVAQVRRLLAQHDDPKLALAAWAD